MNGPSAQHLLGLALLPAALFRAPLADKGGFRRRRVTISGGHR